MKGGSQSQRNGRQEENTNHLSKGAYGSVSMQAAPVTYGSSVTEVVPVPDDMVEWVLRLIKIYLFSIVLIFFFFVIFIIWLYLFISFYLYFI